MANQDEIQRVIWHTPTEYDALQHGPPYLPARPQQTKKASLTSPLEELLAVLQAATLLHQTHHWSTRGPEYYADHLLFERLYNESLEFIDQVAERAVGSGQVNRIFAVRQSQRMLEILGSLGVSTTSDEMVAMSSSVEALVLTTVSETIGLLEARGELSHGTSNLLEGISDKHESFQYLLNQRLGKSTYSYDRS